ncbi:hypothetical protein [Methanobacterium ferruginis]|uniref:nSTAND3 domain-containing NTPase n=1 Tax=Methanobacterium ferruginis TaxID=710191 RepID=UPI002573C43E|nr:hypothetical protein [Methanobacterium ferruginis]
MNLTCNKKDGIYVIYSNSILKDNKVKDNGIIANGKSAIFGVMLDIYLDRDENPLLKYKIMEIYDEDMMVVEFDIKQKKPSNLKSEFSKENIKQIYPAPAGKERDVAWFLNIIGLEDERYRRIVDLYVPPTNFDEISKKLENEKLVFLVGDAEIGKTYTSIKLLFDSYLEGYEPSYYTELRPEKQFDVLNDKLEREIKDKTVVYFEDPWGKTNFNSPETIYRDIKYLINRIYDVDTRVIITSREQIYRQFK